MKLKTLKEIDDRICSCGSRSCTSLFWINEFKIKEEVINWIKEFRKVKPNSKEQILFFYDYKIRNVTGLVDWIKYFFNITDDDLKEKEVMK